MGLASRIACKKVLQTRLTAGRISSSIHSEGKESPLFVSYEERPATLSGIMLSQSNTSGPGRIASQSNPVAVSRFSLTKDSICQNRVVRPHPGVVSQLPIGGLSFAVAAQLIPVVRVSQRLAGEHQNASCVLA